MNKNQQNNLQIKRIKNTSDDPDRPFDIAGWIIAVAFIVVLAIGGGAPILVVLCILYLFVVYVLPSFLYLCSSIFKYWTETKPEKDKEKKKEYNLKAEKIQKEKKLLKEARIQLYQKLRKEIEQMPKYRIWREAVLNLHNRQCQICGETSNLEVHHRRSLYSILNYYGVDDVYKAFECPSLWDVFNGSVVCQSCHENLKSSQYRNEQISNG